MWFCAAAAHRKESKHGKKRKKKRREDGVSGKSNKKSKKRKRHARSDSPDDRRWGSSLPQSPRGAVTLQAGELALPRTL